MKLSIYCGLRAIGWNIHDNQNLVAKGIKRVNIPFDSYYEYIAGLPVKKRIARREKRSMRKNLWRYKSRRENTKKLLNSQGYYFEKEYAGEQILKLRVKALTEKLTKSELYAVFLSLQQKRGYKSLRGMEISESSDYLQTLSKHEENRKQYPSIAAYLLTLSSVKNVVFFRQTHIEEFEKICQTQEITGEFKDKLYKCIYFQRALKTKDKSKCKYEKNRDVIHASNPLFQEFRCWRDAMNIELFEPDGSEIEIPFEMRQKWANDLISGKNLTKASCLKDLGVKKSTAYQWRGGGKLIVGATQLNIDLWQDLFSATDDALISNILSKKYGFDEEKINELLDLNLKSAGWAKFSAKAIKKLLPIIQTGKPLKEAIVDVYGVVEFNDIHLRNVVLEQNFESTKALINALKEKYNIIECVLEIDPLLKKGNKQRKELAKSQRASEKYRKTNEGLSDYQLLKLKLWEEQKGICPYQPEIQISKEDVLTDKYNIDHIVPKSKIYERGYINQVICPKDLNEQKGRMTGIEFAEHLGIKEKYVNAIQNYSDRKRNFMQMKTEDIPTNYVSGFTDYNTKCYLTLFKGAVNIPNKIVSRYVREWNMPEYGDNDARLSLEKSFVMANFDKSTIDYFDNLKENSKQKDSAGVYDLKPIFHYSDIRKMIDETPIFMPRTKFTRKTKFGQIPRGGLHEETVFAQRKKITRNSKGEKVVELLYKVRKPIASLTPNMVSKIMDKKLQKTILERISKYGTHEDGIQSILDEPIYHLGNVVKSVSICQSSSTLRPIHSTDGNGNTYPFDKFEQKCDYVQCSTYRNSLLSVNNGKLNRSHLRLIDFVDIINKNKEIDSTGISLTMNDIVELDNKLYYVLGAGQSMAIRPVWQLEAKDVIKLNNEHYQRLKKVHINQLSEITNVRTIAENS